MIFLVKVTKETQIAYLAVDEHVLAQLMGSSDVLLWDHLSPADKRPAPRVRIQFRSFSVSSVNVNACITHILQGDPSCW